MSTRLRKPSIVRQLSLTALLVGFLFYLGFSALNGQYGLRGQGQLRLDIESLEAESARLAIQVRDYKHRISLFAPERLDPDLLTELALSQVSMVDPDYVLVHM